MVVRSLALGVSTSFWCWVLVPSHAAVQQPWPSVPQALGQLARAAEEDGGPAERPREVEHQQRPPGHLRAHSPTHLQVRGFWTAF